MSHITEEQIEWIYTRYDGDMINCANAVARQAVVSYIDQQARELPVLPDPRIAEEEWFPRLRAGTDFYTVDQLKAYGAACAAHAREMALFTRPMPPQIIGLQDVHDAVTADPTLADCAQDVTELVELTDAQILTLWEETYVQRGWTGIEFARAIERAHGIGVKQ